MKKAFAPLVVALVVLLAGCSTPVSNRAALSPCAGDEASYACQVQRYNEVNGF